MLRTLLQLFLVNTWSVSLNPNWHLSSVIFSVPPNKSQDTGDMFHQIIMLALTSVNSELCRWNSQESCSPTATRTLSFVTARVWMSNSMGLSDLASSLRSHGNCYSSFCIESIVQVTEYIFICTSQTSHYCKCLGMVYMANCCISSLQTPLAASYDLTTKTYRNPVFEILQSQTKNVHHSAMLLNLFKSADYISGVHTSWVPGHAGK